ncbi:MAG: hypothetical protein WBM50_13435 [Acidimicrobiales bacterium]
MWQLALDQFEQRLDDFRSVLTEDGQPASGLWPPASVIDVPLPAEHADRARSLLERARMLEGELVARRDQLPRPRANRASRRTRPYSSVLADL